MEDHAVRIPDWGYGADNGPECWGGLSDTGTCQSPVDLAGAVPGEAPALVIDYQQTHLRVENNGRTLRMWCDPGSRITLGDRAFELVEFHFHEPSEHTVDGERAALEAHLVHRAPDGSLAVVGVMIQAGAENPLLAGIWPHLPERPGESTTLRSASLSPADLLPADRASWRYPGSLTMPPCTEGVEWVVLRSLVEASAEQVASFRAILSGNNRPVQPLNGRRILLDG